MIILKTLKWSNAFSYGSDNKIDFTSHDLIQLIGKNGHGKSSIALILEEVLFNKNSKNVKKADILNRQLDVNKYTIELHFSKDKDEYKIHTTRGSTQSVSLFKNGEDISAHTSTVTYKLIEDILGFDHKTFTQIVYQSNSQSLEFLTATDTNRKKFLIDLLNLSIYTKASEVFKEVNKDVNNELSVIQLSVNTITDWLTKFNKEDLVKKELKVVPNVPTEHINKSVELKEKLRTIEQTNKKVIQNNTYKKILDGIDITPVKALEEDLVKLKELYSDMTRRLTVLNRSIVTVKTICDACGQPIDASAKLAIVESAKVERAELMQKLTSTNLLVMDTERAKNSYDSYVKNSLEWERYHNLIDRTISSELLDRKELEEEILSLDRYVQTVNKDIQLVQDHNNKVSTHNARVDVMLNQMQTMQRDLGVHTTKLKELQERLTNIQLLVKTFSTTGLVAYKIECLVKDLEEIANEYLLDMSDGRFQLSFKVNSSDKLNVVINDNGNDIDILALSGGERSRVNISTLLAIRKLMQTLSDSRINLLILDETIESLDYDGKERLIEVLLKEEHLNTILISHGFSHPLLEKLHIVKENNISRIE